MDPDLVRTDSRGTRIRMLKIFRSYNEALDDVFS